MSSSRSSSKLDYICYGNNIESLTDTATSAQRDPPRASQALRRAPDTTSGKRHVHIVPPSGRIKANSRRIPPRTSEDHLSAHTTTSMRIRAQHSRPSPPCQRCTQDQSLVASGERLESGCAPCQCCTPADAAPKCTAPGLSPCSAVSFSRLLKLDCTARRQATADPTARSKPPQPRIKKNRVHVTAAPTPPSTVNPKPLSLNPQPQSLIIKPLNRIDVTLLPRLRPKP